MKFRPDWDSGEVYLPGAFTRFNARLRCGSG